MELALLSLDEERVLQEPLQDCPDVTDVLFYRLGISQAKGHDQVFLVACGSVECRLPLISLSDAEQMVGVAEVQR